MKILLLIIISIFFIGCKSTGSLTTETTINDDFSNMIYIDDYQILIFPQPPISR